MHTDKPPLMSKRIVLPARQLGDAMLRERQMRKWLLQFHATILVGCTLILTAAFVLHLHGRHEVVVPIVNQPLPGVCTFRRLTGYDCPGCGLTRSVISIAHGHWWDALVFNAAGILFFALIAFQIPYRILQMVRIYRGHPAYHFRRLDQWIVLFLIVVLLLQWIVKLVFHVH